ncbi:MAG: sulfoxide reductase heme-binding subunit YedZ [Alphaproteobacteria bacterium CG_4_10_14_0_2_um_filter_63_37]|nr:MAG: hypothetical protein AUJ55_04190 [Proteobacteria bacterium CG1_02_64_396]PJA24144.1 MAG: sulfoxide reductase heme-binding subunit YedZ [Alphaproteobacteria bacterium CG_4_10_14_0_2_um_filter_63_37]
MLRLALHIIALLPLSWVAWQATHHGLGANPIEAVEHFTGQTALIFLILTLAVTPLRMLTGWSKPLAYRRMLGLFVFFYATLHMIVYLVIDQGLAWPFIWADIVKRPYITIGMLTWLILLPLAITSHNKVRRWLGMDLWRKIHRWVYVAAATSILHFSWAVKLDQTEPLRYGVILFLLLLARRWHLKPLLAPKSKTKAPPTLS